MVRAREGKHKIYKPEHGNKVNIIIVDVKRNNGTEVVKVYVNSVGSKGWHRVAAIPANRLYKVVVYQQAGAGKEEKQATLKLK
jgi:hypothetical protein